MAVSPTFPGVYVQEIPSGVRTITGVSTSIAVFIGRTKIGPINEPVLCLNFSDFERTFSSEYAGSDMARAVRLFFQNGGTRCYVMRIANGPTQSKVTLNNLGGDSVLDVTAKSWGMSGDDIRLVVSWNGLHPESTFNLEVFRLAKNSAGVYEKKEPELWSNLSMDPGSARYVEDFVNQNSRLIEVEDCQSAPVSDGYSRSGRPMPLLTAPDEFRNAWINLLNSVGVAETSASWTGTSSITTSGSYSGSSYKTYTFAVTAGGTVGTDAVDLGWYDGEGNTGIIALPPAYVVDTPVEVAEGVWLAFGAGDLAASDEFSVAVHPPTHRFRISVGGSSFCDVDLSGLDFDNDPQLNTPAGVVANLAGKIEAEIINALPTGLTVTVQITDVAALSGSLLTISSADGNVRIEPSSTFDLAVSLMLGTAQGGIEVSRYAVNRPVPNGIVLDLDHLDDFAGQDQTAFQTMMIAGTTIDFGTALQTAADPSTATMDEDGYSSSVTGNSDGVREKLAIIAERINAHGLSDPSFRWSAEVWGSRLALLPGEGSGNSQGTIATAGGDAVDIGSYFVSNVRYYMLGSLGTSGYQNAPGVAGNDGTAPALADYRNAFEKLDKEVDLFNLMILPSDADHSAATAASLWGPASLFCQKRRAFLLMDPPVAWSTVQQATHPSSGVNSLRIGLVKDHSAIFYPRLTVRESGLEKQVGPSGAVAGLMARIDSSRGVWKASAGVEADLRGVVGLEHKFSDGENGVLNPRAVNTLRIFPNGIVNWGARTMDGDDDFASEYKYIPVRRTALFIEESLYRGLKWVVFEPNDEPLWAQIRLNVGAFMHNLFRQGAFQGTKKQDAYFVKCDSETTTQNDINLGIVNIWVGFAPLKPAEFVILYLQQMTGQIQV